MAEQNMATRSQYIVKAKRRGNPDEWCMTVTYNSRTGKLMYSLEEAEYEVKRLKQEDAVARRKGFTTSSCGGLGVDVAHFPAYDIIGYRILKREVTPYETIYEDSAE